jgi:transcriptional repressor NF-X1
MAPCHSPIPCKADKPCPHKIFVTCECQRIKQEAKCNASRNSDGNSKKVLKCDDECARLERNRKLALALNVDTDAHQDDHIPYSTDTLNMYQQNSAWAATQEKELRLFAANPEEKRLRFKPMPAQQRAFLHSIAEDFGFDSESMDPEPHRHIAIFKTPRFVMAPMKTLAECARIRQVQRLTNISSSVVSAPALVPSRSKPSALSNEPFNGFLITNPRFALTIEEVISVVKAALPKTAFPLELEVNFLPSEEVALRPPLMARANLLDRDVQTMLESVKPFLAQEMTSHKIGKLQLARLDASLNVVRKELDAGPGAGWSQVAAKGGVPTRKLEGRAPIGNKGGFAVLSLSSTRKKKEKEKPVEVADDWEAAELMEEEKERVSDLASSADEGPISRDASLSRTADPGGSSSDVVNSVAVAAAVAPASDIDIPITPSKMRWADMDDDE